MNRRGFVKSLFGGLFGVAIVPVLPMLKGRPVRPELPERAIDLDHPVLKVVGGPDGTYVSTHVKLTKEEAGSVRFMGKMFRLPLVGKWYHLMIWYDPSGKMEGFIDGKKVP